MKKLFLIFVFIFTNLLWAQQSLISVYNSAVPKYGYDKYLQLDSTQIYTGGLYILDQNVCIVGNGAVIDLQNSQIKVAGESQFDISYCVVKNGLNGISVEPLQRVNSFISQCTFYNCDYGIKFMTKAGVVKVENTIISNCSEIGFACEENSGREFYYVNSFANKIPYAEWCSG